MVYSGPFTLDEIRETIDSMRERYEGGQGGLHDAMCRLSLPMALFLLQELDLVIAELENIKCQTY